MIVFRQFCCFSTIILRPVVSAHRHDHPLVFLLTNSVRDITKLWRRGFIKLEKNQSSLVLEGIMLEQISVPEKFNDLKRKPSEEVKKKYCFGKESFWKCEKFLLMVRSMSMGLSKRYPWSVVSYGFDTWTVRKKVDNYLVSFKFGYQEVKKSGEDKMDRRNKT